MIHRLMVIVLLLVLTLPVMAQEDTAGKNFYIYAEINANPYTDVTEFGSGESHTTPQFFKRLGEALIAEGFTPIFLTTETQLQGGNYPVFFEPTDVAPLYYQGNAIRIDLQATEEMDWIYLSPFAAFEHPSLPSGTSGWSAVAEVDPLSETHLDLTVDAVTAISLYILDECEAALSYFDSATSDTQFLDESLFLRLNLLFYRAGCEYTLGNAEEAEALYNEILDTEQRNTTFDDPRLVTDYTAVNLAWIYATTESNREARILLDAYRDVEYTSYSSRETLRFFDRAAVYVQLGEEDRAVDELTRILDLATGEASTEATVYFAPVEIAQLYAERGRLYAQIGREDESMRDYERAIATDATYPKAYYLRGLLYREMEDDEAARADFEQFLTLQEDFYSYYEEDLAPLVEEAEAYLNN